MRYFILVYMILSVLASSAMASQADSLFKVLDRSAEDTNKVQTYLSLAAIYYRTEPDKAIQYGTEAKSLSEVLDYRKGQAYAYKSIGMGYYFKSNYIEALVNWQRSLEVFELIGNQVGISNMLNNLGAVYYNEGDNNKAIEYYLESLKLSEETGDTLRRVTALVNIGSVYYSKKVTHDLALKYYAQVLPISEALGDYDAIGTTAVNMGQIYLEREDDDSALYYFNRALEAYKLTETGNVAYAMLNIGRVYSFRDEYDVAVQYQKDGYDLARKNGAKLEMAQAALSLADTYEQMGNVEDAVQYFKRSRDLAAEIGASYVLKDAYNGLAVTYSEIGDFESAFKYQSLFNDIKDTLYNAEMDKRIQALTLNFEIEKKQGQIDLLTKDQELMDLTIRRQKLQRNAVAITGFLLLLLAAGIFSRYRYVRKTKRIIEYEKDRSEQLLLNVLPVETAEELKERGSATPKHYDMVTVLFTDFKGFTKIAEKLSPQELVENLDFCFHAFDKIIDKYKIEKIKTIGDAYMCAGGIPVKNSTNPLDVVNAALEIREFMEQLKRKKEADGEDFWELRIGIHTGPVIAGVVGNKKFAYDIWGDAVNTASRMESSGIPGKVNISGETYQLIKDEFKCTFRGKIEAKNKGEIDMYIVEGQLGSYIDSMKANTVEQYDHQYQD